MQAWGCLPWAPRRKTQSHLVLCSTSQMGTIRMSRGMIWCSVGGREGEREEGEQFMSCEQRHI